MKQSRDCRTGIASSNCRQVKGLTDEVIAVPHASAAQTIAVQPEPTAILLVELAVTRMQLEQQRAVERQLNRALESRDSIGQAKGILMERYKIGAGAAFALLQEESSRSNRKLVDVAQRLLYSGEDEGGNAQLQGA